MIKTIVGIDPGVNTGFAVKDMDAFTGTLVSAESLKIHEAFTRLASFDKATTLIVVEDARLRDWYGASEQTLYRKFIGNMPMTQTERHAYKGLLLGAGSVKRDCSIWEDFLQGGGYLYHLSRPGAKKTKMKADFFKRVTGYKGRTNEHARDAAFLILSLSKVWANETAKIALLRNQA